MKHLFSVIGLTGLAFVLSIAQFFLTGVYGYILFWPIMGFLNMGYLLKISLK